MASSGQQLPLLLLHVGQSSAEQQKRRWRRYVNGGGPSKTEGSCVARRQRDALAFASTARRSTEVRGAELQRTVGRCRRDSTKAEKHSGGSNPSGTVHIIPPLCGRPGQPGDGCVEFYWTCQEGTLVKRQNRQMSWTKQSNIVAVHRDVY